jgi:uncharacterized protein RhaS with RHS repeats
VNLYAYVGNDPLNFSDPMGLARCGNLEDPQCNRALDDADRAKDDLDNVKSAIDGITEKMTNGEDLTDGEQGFVNSIGEKFGSKFSSQKGLSKLSKKLGKISKKIGDRGQGMILNKGNWDVENSVAYVIGSAVGGFNRVYINDIYFDKTDVYRQETMVHEAAHLIRATGDKYIRGGNNLYFNSSKAWRNADTYACTVYPSVCGF